MQWTNCRIEILQGFHSRRKYRKCKVTRIISLLKESNPRQFIVHETTHGYGHTCTERPHKMNSPDQCISRRLKTSIAGDAVLSWSITACKFHRQINEREKRREKKQYWKEKKIIQVYSFSVGLHVLNYLFSVNYLVFAILEPTFWLVQMNPKNKHKHLKSQADP